MGWFSNLAKTAKNIGSKIQHGAENIGSIGQKALHGFNTIGNKVAKVAHSVLKNPAASAALDMIPGGNSAREAVRVGDSVLATTNQAERLANRGGAIYGDAKSGNFAQAGKDGLSLAKDTQKFGQTIQKRHGKKK
jgi:hypothetical protein